MYNKVTLNSVYGYIELIEKHREEREIKVQSELVAML
jgi:hypothetical protein